MPVLASCEALCIATLCRVVTRAWHEAKYSPCIQHRRHWKRSDGLLPYEWLLAVTVVLLCGAGLSQPLLVAGLRTLDMPAPSVRLRTISGGTSAAALVTVLSASRH